jgi:hypothetical protein
MRAEEAKRIASLKHNDNYDNVIKAIEEAARNGKFSLTVYHETKLSEDSVRRLQFLGYKVQKIGDVNDRDIPSMSFIIEWS